MTEPPDGHWPRVLAQAAAALGRVAARLTRTSDGHGLAVELGAALQSGVHELLVTNDDETTLAHHRFDAAPAGAGP